MVRAMTNENSMFEDDERADAGPCVRILRQESGYVAQGPDFYVWDEDLEEVLRAARDLGRGAPVISSSARFLMIRSSEWAGGEGLAAH
jgi:hypothetical protein